MGSKHSAVLGLAAVALILCACGSPIPQPTPSPTFAPSPTPTSTPSGEPLPPPDPNLHVNGLATVARDGVRLWLDPAGGEPGRRKDFLALAAGTRVILVDGPVTVDGIDYWQLYPSSRGYTTPLGWAAVTKADGTVNLEPFQPTCPAVEGISAAKLGALEPRDLLACYGGNNLSLQGTVTCNYVIADGILAGPMLSSNVFCMLDAALGLKGSVITGLYTGGYTNPVVTGSYSVLGHFDDPGAQHCYQTPFGTSLEGSKDPGDPGAIQECRTFFVVTAVQKLTN